MFGLIAGFVEHGENLEHALVREEQEESGISVKNIRHGASEPWPFPDSPMTGFPADFTGGSWLLTGMSWNLRSGSTENISPASRKKSAVPGR
jgi:NAD+ diphosphatase